MGQLSVYNSTYAGQVAKELAGKNRRRHCAQSLDERWAGLLCLSWNLAIDDDKDPTHKGATAKI